MNVLSLKPCSWVGLILEIRERIWGRKAFFKKNIFWSHDSSPSKSCCLMRFSHAAQHFLESLGWEEIASLRVLGSAVVDSHSLGGEKIFQENKIKREARWNPSTEILRVLSMTQILLWLPTRKKNGKKTFADRCKLSLEIESCERRMHEENETGRKSGLKTVLRKVKTWYQSTLIHSSNSISVRNKYL